jgi:hypothetical protein
VALSKIPNYLQDLIDSDAIGSSAISAAKLPAGSVLQVVDGGLSVANGTSISTELFYEVANVSITPKLANSKFHITFEVTFNTVHDQHHQASRIYFRENDTTVQTWFTHYWGTPLVVNNLYLPAVHSFVHTSSYNLGDSITFRVGLSKSRGSSSVGYPPELYVRDDYNNGVTRIVVQEIAA